MEIEAAVGNDSESRYQRLQIGAEVTILGGLRASTEVNSMSVRTSEGGLDEGQRFSFDVLVGWLFWISHAMHLPLAAPAVQDLGGSDQRLCRARVRQAPWPIRRKGAVGGGHVSCSRCVPSLPLALEARDPENPLCPIVARHPKYIPKLSWVMENKLSEDSALGGDTLGCWYLHERP